MKFELDKYHRNTPDEELLSDLVDVAKKLGKKSVTTTEYKEMGKFHPDTIIYRFNGWLKALQLAGLEKTRNYRTSDEDFFKNIEEVWIKLGHQPKHSDMIQPFSRFHGHAYEYHFGTWRKALEKFVEYVNQEPDSTLLSDNAVIKFENSRVKKHKTSRSISWRLRFIIMRRDNFKCKKCGKSPATDQTITLHVDHITPWSKGGETVPDNLQTLCSICNIGKSDLEDHN